MNRNEARRKFEFENIRRSLARQYNDDYEDDVRALNMPGAKKPVRCEADSTDIKIIKQAIFKASVSPIAIEIKPRLISVGTQTWPTTTFKPLMSLRYAPKKTDMPAQVTADSKTIQSKAKKITIHIKQPNSGVKKSVIQERKITKYMVYKNKSKCANKIVGFNIVSKSGRYDNSTTKRSVTPVFHAKPSAPFQ